MKLFRPPATEKELNGQLSWVFIWGAVTAVGAFLSPDPHGHGTHQQLGLPPCPTVLMFDRPCPGCGLTTSWTALIHGDVATAFRAHPLGPPLYLAFTALALLSIYGRIKHLRLNTTGRGATRALYAALAVFLTFGLTRAALTPHYATDQERLLSQLARPVK